MDDQACPELPDSIALIVLGEGESGQAGQGERGVKGGWAVVFLGEPGYCKGDQTVILAGRLGDRPATSNPSSTLRFSSLGTATPRTLRF
jgi:hypothetical protein